jgi:hypothetical protein
MELRSGSGLLRGISLPIFLTLYGALSCVVLWWAYGTAGDIQRGTYQRGEMLIKTEKMALIITILTSVVWLLNDRRKTDQKSWRIGWNTAWKTWVILIAYQATIYLWWKFWWSHLWTPGQEPISDVMFLGETNAHFFSETGWIAFLIEIIPIMGLVSGGLYFLRRFLLGKTTPVAA